MQLGFFLKASSVLEVISKRILKNKTASIIMPLCNSVCQLKYCVWSGCPILEISYNQKESRTKVIKSNFHCQKKLNMHQAFFFFFKQDSVQSAVELYSSKPIDFNNFASITAPNCTVKEEMKEVCKRMPGVGETGKRKLVFPISYNTGIWCQWKLLSSHRLMVTP